MCCIAPPFTASEDFAIDKPAGMKCPNITADFRCAIHAELKIEGYRGCTVYECYGAGQKVTQVTFQGRNWRDNPELAHKIFSVFMKMRIIHELLMYLNEAGKLDLPQLLAAGVQKKFDELEQLSLQEADEVIKIDVTLHKREVDDLINQVGEIVRNKRLA